MQEKALADKFKNTMEVMTEIEKEIENGRDKVAQLENRLDNNKSILTQCMHDFTPKFLNEIKPTFFSDEEDNILKESIKLVVALVTKRQKIVNSDASNFFKGEVFFREIMARNDLEELTLEKEKYFIEKYEELDNRIKKFEPESDIIENKKKSKPIVQLIGIILENVMIWRNLLKARARTEKKESDLIEKSGYKMGLDEAKLHPLSVKQAQIAFSSIDKALEIVFLFIFYWFRPELKVKGFIN